jgi:phosphate/sulfate permease
MDAGLAVAVSLAVAFAITNGFHDAANSIAALVATRAATALQAIVLASGFNLLGPLLLGAAVANTIGGIVSVKPAVADHRGRRPVAVAPRPLGGRCGRSASRG